MWHNPKNVFIVGEESNYKSAYTRMFEDASWKVVFSMNEADLVQFTGGADVCPSLYGAPPHPKTAYNRARDKYEVGVFKAAHTLRIPMAGICRGGQFLNVMCGGSLWQHVDAHSSLKGHSMVDHVTGQVVEATSTHHQLINPTKKAITLATASLTSFRETMKMKPEGETYIYRVSFPSNSYDDHPGDVEACYYEEQNCLCFQPHPEFHGVPELTRLYFDYLGYYLMADAEEGK